MVTRSLTAAALLVVAVLAVLLIAEQRRRVAEDADPTEAELDAETEELLDAADGDAAPARATHERARARRPARAAEPTPEPVV